MKKSLNAFLLSALVFPGCGHFFLKKYILGTFLAGISIVCFYFILVTTVELAQELSERLLRGEIPMDIAIISAEILKIVRDNGIHQMNVTTSLLFICWIIGMADSYRIGRIEDSKLKIE